MSIPSFSLFREREREREGERGEERRESGREKENNETQGVEKTGLESRYYCIVLGTF